MSKKKKLLIVIGAAFLLIAITVITLLVISASRKAISISDDGLPSIVYNKFDESEEITDLHLYQIGDDESQIIAKKTNPMFEVGNNKSLLVYSEESESYVKFDAYIFTLTGKPQLIAKDVFYYELNKASNKVIFYLDKQPDALVVNEYSQDGDLINMEKIQPGVEYSSWATSSDGSAIVISKSQITDKGNYLSSYFYENGVFVLLAKDTTYPDDRHISNNGDVLYLTEYDNDTQEATLFLKEVGKEPQLIVEKTGINAAISEDGSMIIYTIKVEEDGYNLNYMYDGNETRIIENVMRYFFSRSSNTIVYKRQGTNALFMIKNGGEPVKIAEDATVIAGVSDDGRCVAFLNNLNDDETSGDLFIIRDGEKAELVDTNVSYSRVVPIAGEELMYIMNEDGSVIAYCKEYIEGPTADLYIKQQGKEPILVDERVALGFKFFK